MIPRFRPQIEWRDVARVIPSSKGDPQSLEHQFAQQYGYRYAVWFPLGRVAVRAFLENLPTIGPKAALSPFNCVALGNAVLGSGYLPLWVDTEEDQFCEDRDGLLEALERHDVGCGIPVAPWGVPVAAGLEKAAKKPLLYDYALASLNSQGPKLRDEDGVVYSLNWSKPLAFLSGAFLCGNDAKQADKWRGWRDQRTVGVHHPWFQALGIKMAFSSQGFGLAKKLFEWGVGSGLAGQNEKHRAVVADSFPMASRQMLEITGERLGQRETIRADRQKQVSLYQTELADLESVKLPPLLNTLSHFPIRLEWRDELQRALLGKKIFTSPDLFSMLLNEYPWLKGEVFSPLLEARRLKRTTLHLPLFPGLDASTQQRIGAAIREWHESRADGLVQAA